MIGPPARRTQAGARNRAVPRARLEEGFDRLGGRGRRRDRHDLELDQIAPEGNPALQQPHVVAFHDLEATVEIGFDPAIDVDEAFRRAAALVAEAPVDRPGVAIPEAFDHHELHEVSSSAGRGPAAESRAPIR